MALTIKNPSAGVAQSTGQALPKAGVGVANIQPTAYQTPEAGAKANLATQTIAKDKALASTVGTAGTKAPTPTTMAPASTLPSPTSTKAAADGQAAGYQPGSTVGKNGVGTAGNLPQPGTTTPNLPNPMNPSGGPTGNTPPTAAQQLWADMLNQSNQQEGAAMQSTYADEALNARRASEQNAASGGGVGGGFAGGQAQAQLAGTQQRLGVQQNFSKQQMDMKGAYLQTLIKQAEASKDRDLQSQLQAELDKTNLQIAQMGVDQDTTDSNSAAMGANATTGMGTTSISQLSGMTDAQKAAYNKTANHPIAY